MIVHQMFEVQQPDLGEAAVSETATIAGVNVSHVYLLPFAAVGDPGNEVQKWVSLKKSYLTVVLRSGGRQEILVSRMPLPAVCDISDILAGFEAVTVPLGNIRLRGSDSLAVRLDLEELDPEMGGSTAMQVGVLDVGGVVERIVGYESVVGETSITAEAPRRIFAHRLADDPSSMEKVAADLTFELRFGGQHGSLSWAQARMVTDLVKRGEMPTGVTHRTVVVYDDRNSAVASDVSLRVIRGVEDDPVAIFIEKEIRLARGNAAEVAADARARVEQVRQARGEDAAARLAVHPDIMPAIVRERVINLGGVDVKVPAAAVREDSRGEPVAVAQLAVPSAQLPGAARDARELANVIPVMRRS